MRHLLKSLIVLCGFISSIYASDIETCAQHHCISIVNAGSSGTRFFIYSYDLDKTESPIHIKKVWTSSISTGISKIEHQPQVFFSYLDKLFAEAPVHQLPVYFYATAGMRLLSTKDSNETYLLIKQWFTKHNEWKLVEARTISGEEEGLFGWLAINYNLNRLKQDGKPLVAVIDIGGASTQVSIPVKKSQATSNLFSFTLYGKKINTISYSFLGLGMNELISQFEKVPSCYTQGYTLKSGAIGTGQMPQCISAMSKQMNTHFNLKKVKNLIARYSPKEWYLIGGLANMFQSKIFDLDGKFNSQEVMTLAEKKVCQPQWASLQKKYQDDTYLPKLCRQSSYGYSLLVNGYSLNPKQEIYFFPPDNIPDWSMGVILAHHKK